MDAELAGRPHRSWEVGTGITTSPARGSVEARDALFDAIVAEVARTGFARTEVAAICRRAGVGADVFFGLFADKRACFLAAGRRFVDTMLAAVRTALRDVEDWETGVRVGLGTILEYLAAHPLEARAFLVEGLAAGPEAVAARDVALESFAGLLDLRPGAAAPVRGASAVVSEATVGGVYGIVTRRVRDGQADSLPQLLSSLAYFLLAPVVGRQEGVPMS